MLRKHWASCPPVHQTVAAFVGVKPAVSPEHKQQRSLPYGSVKNLWQGADKVDVIVPKPGVPMMNIRLPK